MSPMRTDSSESPEDMPLPAIAGELDDAAGTDSHTGAGAGTDGPAPGTGDSAPRHGGHREHREPGRRPSRRRRAWQGFTPDQLAARAASVPALVYPDELPVSARRAEIAEAIAGNQVVIVAGETGSGKTTQIPKVCLELGRGVAGMIGHTQPRRIAARSVAERIAHELGTPIGRDGVVGYQVRFTEETGPNTLVKLMTDGILLAEIQSDPALSRYDTIIVDEAHERSLNIDFILGYLARLLPDRPDLKVVITSATIDSARFAEHFGRRETGADGEPLTVPAPVIEVSGRTYPVEIRYRPLLADDGLDTGPDHTPHGAGGRVPDDDSLRELVAELGSGSGHFRRLWEAHDVMDQRAGILRLHHPVVGDVEVFIEATPLAADPGLTLVVLPVAPGSPSARALARLSSPAV